MSQRSERVLIVGGGVIGIACAWYLRAKGFNVTVIDKGKIGDACSRGNCGYICPSHILPLTVPGAVWKGIRSLFQPGAPFRIKPQFRAALYAWFWQFAKRCNRSDMLRAATHLQSIVDASAAEYRRLFDTFDFDSGWHESGMLFLFKSRRAFAHFAATDALLAGELGLAAERFTGDALQSLEPTTRPDLAGGWFYKGDSFLRPEALVRTWAALSADRSINFIEHCELQDVHTETGQVKHLETSAGSLQADHYVFAVGAWSRALGRSLDCRVPVEPGKGYSLTMRRSARCPRLPMIFEERSIGATPFDDAYRLGSMMEFAGFDTSIPEFRMRQFRNAEREYLQHAGGTEVIEQWFGWRPMTWDSLPIIGRLPRLSNAVLATGHNMLGVTMAPATGQLVAEIIAEQATHIDIAPFSPTRFAS